MTARVLEVIQHAAQRFEAAKLSYGHGTANAFDEAAWLVLWRLGLPLDDLDGVAQMPLSEVQMQMVENLIAQRVQTRLPAAYLTQEAWLQGIPFYADTRAIVPRSLIAEALAEGLIDPWLEHSVICRNDTHPHILDLCTGGGSLAVLAALAWPEAVVTASDISTDALEVAHINIVRHQLEERIKLIASDGFKAPELKTHAPFDLIICNPPYVNAQSMAVLPPEFRAEPVLALAGGIDGMDFIRLLLTQAPEYLAVSGILVLEIGHERDHFEAAFPALACEAVWLETSAGSDQVLLLECAALAQYKSSL